MLSALASVLFSDDAGDEEEEEGGGGEPGSRRSPGQQQQQQPAGGAAAAVQAPSPAAKAMRAASFGGPPLPPPASVATGPYGLGGQPAEPAPRSTFLPPPASAGGGAGRSGLRAPQQPWPRTTGTVSPRFTYVVDTANPPVSRLPTWAASAVRTPAAAPGLAAWPAALATPTHSRAGGLAAAPPPAAASGWPAAARAGQGQAQAPAPSYAAPQGSLPYAGLSGTTHIMPAQGLLQQQQQHSSRAAAVSQGPPASQLTQQQLEKALLQAVEDEVVDRLAVAQLASEPGSRAAAPDVPGERFRPQRVSHPRKPAG